MFGSFIDNKIENTWEYLWKNGNPRIKISHVNKTIEGPLKIYYETGELMFEGVVKRNQDEIFLKKYMKHGQEIKTTSWSVSEIAETLPLNFN